MSGNRAPRQHSSVQQAPLEKSSMGSVSIATVCAMLILKQIEIQRARTGASILLLLVILLMITSCFPVTSDIDFDPAKGGSEGRSIVFGRIKILKDGTPWDIQYRTNRVRVYLLSDAGSEPLAADMPKGGSFYWQLAPGHYTITMMEWVDDYPIIRGVFAAFTVSKGAGPVYIGTLTMDMRRRWDPMSIDIQAAIQVKDDYEQALQEFHARGIGVRQRPIRNLMRLESK